MTIQESTALYQIYLYNTQTPLMFLDSTPQGTSSCEPQVAKETVTCDRNTYVWPGYRVSSLYRISAGLHRVKSRCSWVTLRLSQRLSMAELWTRADNGRMSLTPIRWGSVGRVKTMISCYFTFLRPSSRWVLSGCWLEMPLAKDYIP